MTTTKCSCGFIVTTETAEEGYQITHQHFLDEINTHVITTIINETHMHISKQNAPLSQKMLNFIKGIFK